MSLPRGRTAFYLTLAAVLAAGGIIGVALMLRSGSATVPDPARASAYYSPFGPALARSDDSVSRASADALRGINVKLNPAAQRAGPPDAAMQNTAAAAAENAARAAAELAGK